MKVRNKKTGEIGELHYEPDKEYHFTVATEDPADMMIFKTLAKLNEEWEDYEDDDLSKVIEWLDEGLEDEVLPISTNDFVEKLKAWKRLKDGGFRFDHIRTIDGVSIKHKDLDQYTIIAYADEDGCDQECLDLLFGGEE